MVLTFDKSNITGMISASAAKYAEGVTVIDASNYHQLGTVPNVAGAAVNNGAIVSLKNGSTWAVTGTCYLTGLTLDATSAVSAASGHTVAMTVDGVATDIAPGKTYTGAIALQVS